ncbi:hypothetical protein BN946_scf184782.g6 [Trametes cinnabarina]|uniref:Uncharacterized protein n=1 Tax=Pycnoporus cinnabarinus TaxID=5643 RepID=A0A060S984_PYCCI|nr:hypothetical protein BN946_scf184782.g6 [Trametes cinnabarina]
MPDNAASNADAYPIVAASTSVETPGSNSQSATGMDLDSNNSSSTSQGRRARKKAVPRVPPLFERKGHVVFRGDEKLTEVDPPA